MRLPFLATTACLSIAAFGCSANVSGSSEAADAADAPSSTTAVVMVERTSVGATLPAAETSRGEAVARFMRVRSTTGASPVDGEEALRIVGADLDFPALGTCVSVSRRAVRTIGTSTVQLLDVGSVSLEANGLHTSLSARQVPDVVDIVSGVVYARAADAELMPASTPYTLHVAGTPEQDIAGFTIAAHAPGEPELRIADQDARAGSVVLGVSDPVFLVWDQGDAGDVIYVDITATNTLDAPRMPTIRCAFADTGSATLATTAFAAGDEGTLSVHRLHRESFRAPGITSGEVRFDFARMVTFTRAAR
jgi:hypothetical protein